MRAMLVAALMLISQPLWVHGAVLGKQTIVSGNSIYGDEHRVRPKVDYVDAPAALFDQMWIDSTSIGMTLEASAESDPDFSEIASRLANGLAEFLCVGTCEQVTCSATCGFEGARFGLSTEDFQGAVIRKVGLRVDALSFARDSRVGQVVLFTFTLTVEGDWDEVLSRSTSWGVLKATYR